tara:strand:+ start:1055 stop:1318 length:264 start_codon:yes stop_codon:yes gene_type:complete
MKDIPNAVSFKELNSLLNGTLSVSCENTKSSEPISIDWDERIKSLLKEIESSSAQVAAEKTTDQVMALGSFRTHLMLSLQALKAANL